MHRGHAEGELGVQGPVALRDDSAAAVRAVIVHVDQARHDRLARRVDYVGTSRNADVVRRADGRDAVAFDDDRAAIEDLVAAHRDDSRPDQRERSGGHVGLGDKGYVQAALRRFGQLIRRPFEKGERVGEVAREQLAVERPVELRAVAGEVEKSAGVARDASERDGSGLGPDRDLLARARKRRDIGIEPLGEGQPLAVGRHAELGGVVTDDFGAFVAAVQVEADEGPLALVLFAPGSRQVEAIAAIGELRVRAVARDPCRLAAGRGNRVDAGLV